MSEKFNPSGLLTQFPDIKTNNPDILFEKAMHYADRVEEVEMELNAERAVVSVES